MKRLNAQTTTNDNKTNCSNINTIMSLQGRKFLIMKPSLYEMIVILAPFEVVRLISISFCAGNVL